MPISYQDLNPMESSFILNKKEYFLRPFDLAARVWADDYFSTEKEQSGLIVLSKKIQDLTNFEALYRCCWHLLKKKRDFGFYENFVHSIENGDDDSDSIKITMDLYKAFTRSLGLSEPQLEKFKEDFELKKF